VEFETLMDKALATLGRRLTRQTPIAVNRIQHYESQTVSNFSAFLGRSISAAAARKGELFRVVETRGSVQAIVQGSFTLLGEDVEVNLELVSAAGDREVLGSAVFRIPGEELRKRRLSVLPPNTTEEGLRRKTSILSLYDEKDNAFILRITPENADGIYYDGQNMFFTLYAEKDCYFKIIHVDVDENTQVMYPISPRDNNFLKAGEARRIPDNNARIRLHEPFGVEYFIAEAYDEPFTPEAAAPKPMSAMTKGATRSNPGTKGASWTSSMDPAATAKFSYSILARD
jgi:hypothetical protein